MKQRLPSCRDNAIALMLGIAASASASTPGQSETLNALVAREAGVPLGRCVLSPAPVLGGKVHAVIPARFENPAIWTTRTLLLVGVDEDTSVNGQLELALSELVPPRDVVSLRCVGRRLDLRLPHTTLSFEWDGHALKPMTNSRP